MTAFQQAAERFDRAVKRESAVPRDELAKDAAEALDGRIGFNDGRYIFIGRSGIDWMGGHIADHVWKERPKRFLWFPGLFAAYRESGEEQYAIAARDYLEDWMRAHPARPDWKMAPYDNGLNLGIRVAFFAEAIAVFSESQSWDKAFVEAVLTDIQCELRFIAANLSPKGNFRMKQAMTLIESSLRLPMCEGAPRWQRTGVLLMNDAARRQVLPDGAHYECTAGYHHWMTRLFIECLRLGREWPELAFTFQPSLVVGMLNYLTANIRPNGTFAGLHDIEGAWEGEHPDVSHGIRQRFLEDFGISATPLQPAQVFPYAGQAFLRDSWENSAAFVTFDATRWGGAHCHLSRNAIQFHSGGRTLLVDPGRINYEMRNPVGPYAKSTRAHSTVNLNGWNQFTTNPDFFRSYHADGFDCVSSKYSAGYWPKPFGWWFSEGLGHGLAATHTRHLFWVHRRWCVVIDEVCRWNEEGRGADFENPTLELNWQFSPGRVEIDPTARQAWTCHPDSNLLLCCARAPLEATMEVHEAETSPLRGWIRDYPRYREIAAPQLSVICRPWQGHVDTMVTVLIPFAGNERPPIQTQCETTETGLFHLTVVSPNGESEDVFWRHGLETMIGEVAGIETDALLLYRGATGAPATVDAQSPDLRTNLTQTSPL